jgi:DNA repair exonuclease SbcCD ATPase subunit
MVWTEQQIKEPSTARTSEKASKNQLVRIVNFPTVVSEDSASSIADEAIAALELVSEAAKGVKCAEDRAAESMARAQTLANDAVDNVRLLQSRIERAEEAKRQADAELAENKADNEKLRNELKEADARIADQENVLATAERRASVAEKRANDAEAALKRLTHAIRTQLPTSHEVAATKQAATN